MTIFYLTICIRNFKIKLCTFIKGTWGVQLNINKARRLTMVIYKQSTLYGRRFYLSPSCSAIQSRCSSL